MNRAEQANALRTQLAGVGIYAMYGGGKGHGFWLMESEQQGDAVDTMIREGRGFDVLTRDRKHGHPSGMRTIQNDGARSGNPYFTMFCDAQKVLADRLSRPSFVVDGNPPCTLQDILEANADDPQVCEWARSAKPGDSFPALVECRCVHQQEGV